LAIDADQGGIHVAVGTGARGGTVRVEHALTVPVTELLTPANAADLGRQLRDALRAGGIAAGPTLATVGRDRVILKDVKIPRVGPSEEPNLVRFQATKDATEASDAVVLDYYTLDRDDPDGQVRAVTVSVRKDVVAAYKALCQAAGLKLAGVTPRPQGALAALERAIATGAVTEPEAKRASVAVLTRGEKWGELLIARDGQVVFSRAVSATALNSESQILSELRRNLAVYNGQSPQQPVEAVYVAEAAGPVGWSGRIRSGLQVPVQAFDPLAGVESFTPADARGHFATLVGLLQLKTRGTRLPIDLAAPREPVVARSSSRNLMAAGVAVLAFLIIGGLGFGYMKVKAKDATYAKLTAEKVDLEKTMKDYEEDDKRIKALKEWDESRINWLDEIYDLTARFPDIKNARLEQFRAEPLTVQKGAKTKYVARITLKVATNDPNLMNNLQNGMNADKKYHNINKQIKPTTGLSGGFTQTYEVRADIERRPANEYVRKLTATAPSKPSKLSDTGSGSDLEGGFGGQVNE
jgi:Tfp pilus assembly PilM family ATPase